MRTSVTADKMREIDKRAREEFDIAPEALMENAGHSVFEVIARDLGDISKQRIVIFCGKGNNGGDGFVLSRCLLENTPSHLTVYHEEEKDIKKGPAYDNFIKSRNMGVDLRPFKEFFLESHTRDETTVYVDAVFGTGFKGELPEAYSRISSYVNASETPLYAVDVPSGLDATTGKAARDCFRAFKTVTFGLAKKGFYQNDGPRMCGDIVVKDIGFPAELLSEYS